MYYIILSRINIAYLCTARLSYGRCVGPSVTRGYWIKTNKRRIMRFSLSVAPSDQYGS